MQEGGKTIYLEGIDCIGFTVKGEEEFPLRTPQPLEDFIREHKEQLGQVLVMDPSGKKPPAILTQK